MQLASGEKTLLTPSVRQTLDGHGRSSLIGDRPLFGCYIQYANDLRIHRSKPQFRDTKLARAVVNFVQIDDQNETQPGPK